MQQRCILHSEQISRKGEIKYFQIPLQGTAIRIIAVEASAFLLTSVPAPAVVASPVTGTTPSANNCPNPGTAAMEALDDVTDSTTHMRVFRVGDAVNPGFVYSCGVYSVVISATAVDGDTPATIASKLATAVNSTTLAEWNQHGGNTQNYKPSGSTSGALLTLTTDRQHSFFASASGSCTATTPSTQLLEYDPLFKIVQNERAGILSLQSPDATDIFLQCDAWRLDRNTGFGDYTLTAENGEWIQGRKRYSQDVSISTASPILEAYYKDSWGVYHGKDVAYGLNIFLWFERAAA